MQRRCAVIGHQTKEHDAHYRPRLPMRETSRRRWAAPRRELHRADAMHSRSIKNWLGIHIAVRAKQAGLNAGSERRRSSGLDAFIAAANRGHADTGIASVADGPLRQGWLLENQSSAASAHETTLASHSDGIARMRGVKSPLPRCY
jgi:hypothetical protein